MENDIQKHKDKLYSQIQDEYGKLVYTYTCHFKIADRLQKEMPGLSGDKLFYLQYQPVVSWVF